MIWGLTLLGLAGFLAAANGSNDVSKGIATLVGSSVASYRRAVVWGSVWTMVGALLAGLFSYGLVSTFSGKGLLYQPAQSPHFLAAVALGAAAWVVFSSVTGLPVSTTHALVGALCGIGVLVQGAHGVLWPAVMRNVFLPLLLSPVMSWALMTVLFPVLRRGLGRWNRYCLCLERQPQVQLAPVAGEGALGFLSAQEAVVVDRKTACGEALAQVGALDGLHWLTAGLTSLARGINDTPKIAAVGFGAVALLNISPGVVFMWLALSMGLGSLWGGLRVTETLAERVTRMNPMEGFASNLATSLLVLTASKLALPVSTTHVSTGAIFGIGLWRKEGLRWGMVKTILLAWGVTLPCAAVFGMGMYRLLSLW